MASPVPNMSQPDRIVPMRLIVCGVQRTGTLSMRRALFMLGLHDCHHMHSVRDDPQRQAPHWIRALEAKFENKGPMPTRADWDKVLGDCQAVADVPSALFGPELAECYPEAKVVILNRDPESWYNSVLNSIHSQLPFSTKAKMLTCAALDGVTRAWIGFAMTMGRCAFGFDHRAEKEKALAWYKRTYDDFRARIPADRRIEYKVGDGWGPLCELLDVPVPMVDDGNGKMVEAPFPHVNDRASFKEGQTIFAQKALGRGFDNLVRFASQAIVTGSAVYGGYLLWKTRFGGRL